MDNYKELGYKTSITLFTGLADIVPVALPLPEPPNLNKIPNRNRPTSSQYFERTELPKKFDALPKIDQEKFIFQEWDRRINGYWFMNNGVLTHMVGSHYFYVDWWKAKWGRPIFCTPEWKYFLHWHHRLYDPTSYGITEMSSRQTTKSTRAACIMYDIASRHKNFHAGIQSKTDDDAYDFFQGKIVYGWRNLPQFFKPKSDNTSNPKAELVFSEPASKAKNAYTAAMADELTSRIDYRSSNNGAYDGTTLGFYINDEAGKLPEDANVLERWEVVRQAMYDKQNGVIRGKSIHTTTVELMDKKGGKQWRKLWTASSTEDGDGKSQLNALGQTPSGLHQHFTPAFEWGNYDKYGFPDEERNKKEIEMERKQRKGESLASVTRKRPMTIRECFTLSGKECHFNADIIDAVLEKYVFENKDIREGYFSWKDDKIDTTVIWNDKSELGNGWMKISHFPDVRLQNKSHFEGSWRFPDNTNLYCAGADPYRKDTTKDTRNSDFGFAIYRKWDSSVDSPNIPPYEYNGDKIKINHVTDRFCLTLRHRFNSRDEYCEQALMAAVFFGCEVFSETNVPYLNDYFIKRGYAGYLFHRQNLYTGKFEKEAGQDTTGAVKNEIYTEIWNHIEKNGYREVHDDWLREAREIDADMTEYDLFVACGYAKLAAKRLPELMQDVNFNMGDYFDSLADV